MSLLDNGPHTVKVWMEEEVTDSYGNAVRRPVADPVEITGCLIYPVASIREGVSAIDARQGQRVDAAWRLLARDAPLGWWSRVEFNGVIMTVLGGPLKYTTSAATNHISCTLTEER